MSPRSDRSHPTRTVLLFAVLATSCIAGPLPGLAEEPTDAATDDTATADDTATVDDSTTANDAASDTATVVDTDASGDGDDADSGCPALEAIDDSPLPVESSGSLTESTKKDGYDDDYVYNKAGDRKLGLRRDWGGSIVFFGRTMGGPGMNVTNTIDGVEANRQVQILLYDRPERSFQGCAYNASCKTSPTKCPETMAYLGWNPTQGGNRCNVGSGVGSISLANGEISLLTPMLQWNPNWDFTDCKESCGSPASDRRLSDVELTQRVRFVRPNVVELGYSVRNLGSVDHAASVHELPTLYATFGRHGTPDLYRLFDSSSKEVTSGWATDANDYRWQNFASGGGWATLQNSATDYGVALYYESGMSQFQAWNKLENPTKFNNFRGRYAFPLRGLSVVNARAYLILGGLKEVAAETSWLDKNLPPFGFLDAPAAGATVEGSVTVHGWALDNRSVSRVVASVDGGTPVPLTYGTDRPDVCGAWPGYPACSHGKVGFQGSLDLGALPAKACGHVLEVRAIDGDGNEKVIARRRVGKK